MTERYIPQPLRCREVHWADDKPQVKIALQIAPEHLPHDKLVEIVRELDRRFMQLHDKVSFERTHDLVDYGRVMPREHYGWGSPYTTLYKDIHGLL